MSPAVSPGEEALARLLAAQTPVKLIDNRCFCPSAYGSRVPHVKGVTVGCEHFELAPVKFTIPDVTP